MASMASLASTWNTSLCLCLRVRALRLSHPAFARRVRSYHPSSVPLGPLQRWTDVETEQLKRLRDKGASRTEIQTAFPDRTWYSIRFKTRSMYPPHLAPKWAYTPEEDAIIMRAKNDGLGIPAIRELLPSRSCASIRTRWGDVLQVQTTTKPSAATGRQRWTAHETDALFRMRDKEGLSWDDIATALGRAKASCKRKWTMSSRRNMGSYGNRVPWLPADERALRDGLAAGMSPQKMATRLGRPLQAIRNKLYMMRENDELMASQHHAPSERQMQVV